MALISKVSELGKTGKGEGSQVEFIGSEKEQERNSGKANFSMERGCGPNLLLIFFSSVGELVFPPPTLGNR